MARGGRLQGLCEPQGSPAGVGAQDSGHFSAIEALHIPLTAQLETVSSDLMLP